MAEIVAVPDAAGLITFWRMAGATSHAALQLAWIEEGLDPEQLPQLPSDTVALRRAVKARQSNTIIARRLKRADSPSGWALIEESTHRTVEHRPLLHVLPTAIGTLAFELPDGSSFAATGTSPLASLANEIRRSGATSLITVEETDAEHSSFPISTPTMSALSDNIIRLAVQVEHSVRHRMWIGKVRNSRCDQRVRDLVLTPTGLEITDAAAPVGASGFSMRSALPAPATALATSR